MSLVMGGTSYHRRSLLCKQPSQALSSQAPYRTHKSLLAYCIIKYPASIYQRWYESIARQYGCICFSFTHIKVHCAPPRSVLRHYSRFVISSLAVCYPSSRAMNNGLHNEASANKIEPIVGTEIRECPRRAGLTKLLLWSRGFASLMRQSTCIQRVTIVNSVICGAVIQ